VRGSHGLRAALTRIGMALGGEPGARLAQQLSLPTSGDTVLRLVRADPLPTYAAPRVLGIDDWSWRRGRTFGTILVDLEMRRPVDLLADRAPDTVAAWLAAHPGTMIVARDRSGGYAEGVRRGAPTAIHVADRWHLLVRRFTRRSIPVRDGKGSEGRPWVNDLPGGESQRGQEHVA